MSKNSPAESIGAFTPKEQAIEEGTKIYNKNPEIGTLNIGIGKVKYVRGERVHTMLPLHFYTN